MKKINRQSAVAGTFYPSGAAELQKALDGYFKGLEKQPATQPLAIIVPHAGYVFSAGVAAKAFSEIDRNAQFEHVFIIGSSHTMHFEGVSVFTLGDFITPLGNVEVDPLAKELSEKYAFVHNNPKPHLEEHSIEVQLPFLQYWLQNPFKIIPILIGGTSEQTSKQLSEVLEPYLNSNNLFIISTDFSHYPAYSEAITIDKIMADAIAANSATQFLTAKQSIEHKHIANLVTATCGWTSVLALLYITEKNPNVVFKKIAYKNSGDSQYGSKDKVVGYNAICAYPSTSQTLLFSDADKQALLKLARKTIVDYIVRDTVETLNAANYSPSASVNAGVFVTLRKHGQLRGCIGNFGSNVPLYKNIQTMAISSATKDYRFNPVEADEIPELSIEISVLTPMQRINSDEELVLGKHGIFMKKEGRQGTFLPQVATETGWTKEEFLGHCARDKASIGWDGWRSAELYVYETIIFEEPEK
jgi:AmmeMemoRadiSam system protein B/AmmeMemoRadiSam system protein A